MKKLSNILLNKKNILIICLIIVILLLSYQLFILKQANDKLKNDFIAHTDKFELLSPSVAWLSVSDFIEKQKHLTVSYQALKKPLTIILNNNVQGKYGLYFEDLTTGAWVGINEKDEFTPASLLKVPTMVGVLKMVEQGNVTLDQELALDADDLDLKSGSLGAKGAGYNITIKDLLIALIKESDNTAVLTLNRRVLDDETYVESRLAMGLPMPTNDTAVISPKQYSNILRSLYLSSYLRRTFSELGLSIMLETDFNSEIPAGVPNTVKVAHKVGFYKELGIYHDCGIIYVPNKPYILCIMSKDGTQEEADRIISEVSRMVYNYVTSNSTTTN